MLNEAFKQFQRLPDWPVAEIFLIRVIQPVEEKRRLEWSGDRREQETRRTLCEQPLEESEAQGPRRMR